MGVKNLTKILQQYSPSSIKISALGSFANKHIAIDSSYFLQRFAFSQNPHPNRHIVGFYRLATYLQKNNITPIFVFDGRKRLIEKKKELQRRKEAKEKIAKGLLVEKNRKTRLDALNFIESTINQLPQETFSYVTKDLKTVYEEHTQQLEKSDALETKSTHEPTYIEYLESQSKIIQSNISEKYPFVKEVKEERQEDRGEEKLVATEMGYVEDEKTKRGLKSRNI